MVASLKPQFESYNLTRKRTYLFILWQFIKWRNFPLLFSLIGICGCLPQTSVEPSFVEITPFSSDSTGQREFSKKEEKKRRKKEKKKDWEKVKKKKNRKRKKMRIYFYLLINAETEAFYWSVCVLSIFPLVEWSQK